MRDLSRLEYVGVRSHPQTLHILEDLGLEDRLRLTTSHLLAVPAVVKATIVFLLSIVLAISAVMAIRAESKSRAVRGSIAGLAIVLLAIVLRPEKNQ